MPTGRTRRNIKRLNHSKMGTGTMYEIRKVLFATAVLSALMANAAQAARPGFYIGAGLGQATVDQDAGDFGYQGDSNFKVDDDDSAWKAFIGYNFLPWLGIEGGYKDFGNFTQNIRGETFRVDPTGWDAYLVGSLPLGPVDLFAKVGAISLKTDANYSTFGQEDDTDTQLAYGAGIAYNIGHVAFRVEAEGFDDNEVDDFYMISAGVTYSFGSDKPKPAVAAAPVAAEPEQCADTDNDGVCDADDQCPNTPAGAGVDSMGCVCHYTLNLEFAFDSAELSVGDEMKLDALVPVLNNPKLKYVRGSIDGYTDSVGSEQYNQGLSQRRADAVMKYLESKGANLNGRFTTHGYGESDPVASNDTEEGRARNRRVVLRRTDCR